MKAGTEDLTAEAEDTTTAEMRVQRVAELEATVFRCWSQRREAVIKMGRAFIELKKIVGHGKWQKYFKETFRPKGIELHTAERYMKAAKEAEDDAKNDKLTIFNPSNDEGARKIKGATEQAAAEGSAASGHESRREVFGLDKLPLHLSNSQKIAMDSLRKSVKWSRAEKKILRLLRKLWVKYGIVKKNAGRAT